MALPAIAQEAIELDSEHVGELSPYAQAVFHGEQAFEVATIGDWQLACDNTARCTLLGHAGFANPNQVVANTTRSLAMRIEIGPDGDADRLELIPDLQAIREGGEEVDWAGPFLLAINILRGWPVAVPFNRSELGPTEREAVLTHLRSGAPLTGDDRATGDLRLRLPYVGFAEAIAEIAQRQSDIAQWRRMVQPDDGPVTLERGVAAIVSGHPPVVGEQMDWCGSGIDAADLQAFVMAGGTQVWQHACPVDDGRNRWSRWFRFQPGGEAELIRFERPPGFAAEDAGFALANATFHADFGVLHAQSNAWPHHEDCGTRVIWGWTGTGFVAIERRVSLACQGIMANDWLVTWRREVME